MFRFLDFLGYWKWPNILAITLVPFAFFFLSWKPAIEPAPLGTTILGPEEIGPWTVVIGTNARQPLEPGEDANWRVRFCSGCYEQISRAELALGNAKQALWDASPLAGDPQTLSATLRIPPALPANSIYLWLIVEARDGRRHTVSWLVFHAP
ncbi:MAG: hypothetical protein ACREQ7_00625 [Candidatus Binatia bacterium]